MAKVTGSNPVEPISFRESRIRAIPDGKSGLVALLLLQNCGATGGTNLTLLDVVSGGLYISAVQGFGGGISPGPWLDDAGGMSWPIVGGGGTCCFLRDRRRIPTAATAMTAAATTIRMANVVESNPSNSPPTVPVPVP